jgi:hypothetical protein
VIYLKKFFVYLYTFLIFAVPLTGCNLDMTKIVYNKEKPFAFYYTNEVAKHISLEGSYKAVIFETNLYKEKEIPSEDKPTIQNFLKNLKEKNFIKKPTDLPQKPVYKLYLSFSKDKYIMNVYSDKYVSVYPWDGNFEMDYIDMTGTHTSDNIFYLCSYITPRTN